MRRPLILLVGFVLGCATGIDPPEPTPMVEIRQGLDLFVFGTTDLCKNGELFVCQAGVATPPTFPTMRVKLTPFAIDVHEVTNLQYEHCVARGACSDPFATNVSAEILDYFGNGSFDDFPVVNVSFEQASAYCAFVGKRLPTEYEWERVAAGPATDETQKRLYPSDTFPQVVGQCQQAGGVAVQFCGGGTSPAPAGKSPGDFVEEPGVGRVFDLAGNVSEWTSSVFEEKITCKSELPPSCDCSLCRAGDFTCFSACGMCPECDEASPTEPCFALCGEDGVARVPVCVHYGSEILDATDPRIAPTGGDRRVVKGGHFAMTSTQTCRMRAGDREPIPTGEFGARPTLGFRCAKDLQ